MKKSVATLVLSLGVLAVSFAQKNQNNMNKRVEQRLEKITKELSLTPEQISKVKPILLTQEKRKNEEKKKRKENRIAFKNEMGKVLNTKQFQIFKKKAKKKKKINNSKKKSKK